MKKRNYAILLAALLTVTGCNKESSSTSVESSKESSSEVVSSIEEKSSDVTSSVESSSEESSSVESSIESSSSKESSIVESSSEVSSSEVVTVTSITITNSKEAYVEGDKVDTSTLSFNISFSNGTSKTVGYDELDEYGLTLTLTDSKENEISFNNELMEGSYVLTVYSGTTAVGSLSIEATEKEYPFVPGGEKISDIRGTFDLDSGVYTAKKYRSVEIVDESFTNGTFSIVVIPAELTLDHYIIFDYDQTAESYYSFGFNSYKKAQITYFDGSKLYLVKALNDVEITTEAKLTVSADEATHSVDFWVDNNWVYGTNIEVAENAKVGFYAGAQGSEFTNMIINNDSSYMDSDFENYKVANGAATISSEGIDVTEYSTVAYHSSKEFVCGELEATIVTKNAENTFGLAFCLDNNGQDKFFRESSVSYYYIGVSIQGTLYLMQVKDGALTTLKSKNTFWFDSRVDHTLKVVKDAKEIHVFFDGLYQLSYAPSRLLKGTKFGICSSTNAASFKKITVKNYATSKDAWKAKYDVASGSWYGLGNLVCSTVKNSLLVSKNPVGYNGTIDVEMTLGKNVGTSLVFRLTKPTDSTYYETQEGLSYYAVEFSEASRIRFGRIENGVAVWSANKYMPNFMNLSGRMKVVMNGNKINAYWEERCVFEYIDDNPLTGTYVGLRSNSAGAALCGDITYSEDTTLLTSKYLIFGHSYTQLWHRYKEDFASLTNDIRDIGIGGSQCSTMSNSYLNEIASYKAEYGIYWNGINDIDADIPTATIISNVKKCLDGIKAINSNFKCAVLAASKCTHEKPMARMSQIEAFNNELKTYCQANDWLVYVDVQEIYCVGGEPQASYFVDNLHPTVAGYQLVAPLVIEALNSFTQGE